MTAPDDAPAGRAGSASGVIRTVLGDIPAGTLGPCDYHDHLFQVTPLLPGDELDNEELSGREAAAMVTAGLGAMVEATPTGLGRQPAAVARVCAATGLKSVHATGAHHAGHYPAGHWLLEATVTDLARRFAADVADGLPAADVPERGVVAVTPDGAPVRAGLVKAGVRYWQIGPFERRALEAAAATALTTGVPVMVHLDYGSAAWEVHGILTAAGVPASRIVLAHIDRNLDPGLHAELTAAGLYIGYDGMARHKQAPDAALLDCLERTLALGGDLAAQRIVIGADVARSTRFVAYGGMPGLEYLPRRFLPRLRRAVGDDIGSLLVTTNPARLLTLT
ncbi:MAG: hypothetical protein LBR27_10550 [Bifidobacteriaceae bacterium]|jgi:phosphotriesterase-related protein|nr:hypothetical protein [Bifidobacteriaceae bacterium]